MKQPTEQQEQAIQDAIIDLVKPEKHFHLISRNSGSHPLYLMNCRTICAFERENAGVFTLEEAQVLSRSGKYDLQPLPRPQYTRDLNAVHEVEMSLNSKQGAMFRYLLQCNSDGRNARHATIEAAMCHASALERCMALLETLAPGKLAEIMKEPSH